eukprot:288236_1
MNKPKPLPEEVVWGVLIAVSICIVIGICSIVMIYKHRYDTFIQKRSLSIVVGLNLSILLQIITQFGLLYSKHKKDKITFITFVAIYFFSWFCTFFFLNVKNFSIFYKYKWQYYTLQLQWQQIINPSFVESQQKKNCFLKHNKTCGKLRNQYILFGIIHLILVAICAYFMQLRMRQLVPNHLHITFGIINAIITVTPFICYIIIVLKTPTFSDVFWIHSESKFIAILATFIIIIYLTANITLTVNGIITPKETFIFAGLRTFVLVILILVTTFMVIYQNNKILKLTHERVSTYHTDDSIDENTDINLYVQNKNGLDKILSNEIALNLFMHHLSREYSMENLLAYIEICQFQKWVIKQINDNHINDDSIKNIKTMNTLKNIPNSEIIEEKTSLINVNINIDSRKAQLDDVKLKAHKLFYKYIKTGVEFEINISYPMRQRLADVLDDGNMLKEKCLTLSELALLFEECKNEIKLLLTISYERFRYTDSYQQMIEMVKKS